MEPKTLHHNVHLLSQAKLTSQGYPKELVATSTHKLAFCKGWIARSKRSLLRLIWAHQKRLRYAIRSTRDCLLDIQTLSTELLNDAPLSHVQKVLQLDSSKEDPLKQCLDLIDVVRQLSHMSFNAKEEARLKVVSRWALVDGPDLWKVLQHIVDGKLLQQLQNLEQSLGLVQDAEADESISPLKRVQEMLTAKDAIIETLQRQLEERETIPVEQPLEAPSPTPVPAPETEEHELHALSSRLAEDVERILNIINVMEQGQLNRSEELPAPLSLARDIGLQTTGRKPQRNLDECHSALQEAIQRLKALQKLWYEAQARLQQLEQQTSTAEPTAHGESWLELNEEEVKELERSLGRLQVEFEKIKNENQELKQQIQDR